MERPLAASPGTALMDGAALAIPKKNAMAVRNLHLDDVTGDPPVSAGDLLAGQVQGGNHARLVLLVQRNGCLALAAVAAAGADKDVRDLIFLLCFLFHRVDHQQISETQDIRGRACNGYRKEGATTRFS